MTAIKPTTASGDPLNVATVAPSQHAQQQLTVASGSGNGAGELQIGANVPDYLRELSAGDQSTSLLKQYVVPPRIKFVQPTSREPFQPPFAAGDMLLLPYMKKIAALTDSKTPAFTLTPVMFFPEWCCWNPIGTKGTLKGIRDRSFDSRSVLAIKSRDPKLRQAEVCPEAPKDREGKPQYLKYLQHLNYIFVIHGEDEHCMMPISMVFMSGEHNAGTTLNGLIQMRKAPLWGCNFQAVIKRRTNDKGWWIGADIENPSIESGVVPFVDAANAPRMKVLHEEFRDLYEQRLLQIDVDDEGLQDSAPVDTIKSEM